MNTRIATSIVVVVALAVAWAAQSAATDVETSVEPRRIVAALARLPMAFEPVEGRNRMADFVARGAGHVTYLAPSGVIVARTPAGGRAEAPTPLRMRLVQTNPHATAAALAPLPGKQNYVSGRDSGRWRMGVPTYARVAYAGVYTGIDVVYYGNQGQLEYDFIVHPGADPAAIRLAFDGITNIAVDPDGDLVLATDDKPVRMRRPIAYQDIDGERVSISSRFTVQGHQVAFDVGAYDGTRPLIIDPVVIVYSTYLGGSGHDVGNAIAVDGGGNVYVAGETRSLDFPVTDGSQLDDDPTIGPTIDAFVTKIAADGSAILYSTYLGGTGTDRAYGIAVDPLGNAYISGETASIDFPTTANASGPNFRGELDAFITKLDGDGAVMFSTYLGGGSAERGLAIAVDAAGNAYVTGATSSSDFPTLNALQSVYAGGFDAFVAKLNATGTLLYSTFLGGSNIEEGRGIAVDTVGQAHVTGRSRSSNFPAPLGLPAPSPRGLDDVFVVKLDPSGQTLLYSTFLGGGAGDIPSGLGVDALGNAYVGGSTDSADFPVTAGAFDTTFGTGGTFRMDGFVAKLNSTGGVVYATYLGGSDFDSVNGIAVDAAGNSYLTGGTLSADFPTLGAFDDTLRAVSGRLGGDAFVAKLNPAGSALVYSSYLGGNDQDAGFAIALDSAGNAYLTGLTRSSDFPRVRALQPRPHQNPHTGTAEAFVVKVSDAP